MPSQHRDGVVGDLGRLSLSRCCLPTDLLPACRATFIGQKLPKVGRRAGPWHFLHQKHAPSNINHTLTESNRNCCAVWVIKVRCQQSTGHISACPWLHSLSFRPATPHPAHHGADTAGRVASTRAHSIHCGTRDDYSNPRASVKRRHHVDAPCMTARIVSRGLPLSQRDPDQTPSHIGQHAAPRSERQAHD